ncbi:hypothetical protein [Desulfoluna spongiiphila]|uniref:PilC beta-propeller domain-containing protein n=1 Tax=Desulfoluna spongiiphila TaxID=419481 RepID=A0A1G5AKR7_9BACT|nr:hypothetical protein [Desulfoluna spongiiphila]SCX78390.1 hypothetical protein SAMN05216233_101258 [Desulfoluna spongiiphila]
MKRILMMVVFLFMSASIAAAYDIDVFDECSVAIKPNVLFLMDTSLSMRRQDVIDDGIEDYNSEGAFVINYDSAGNLVLKDKDGKELDQNADLDSSGQVTIPISDGWYWDISRDERNDDPCSDKTGALLQKCKIMRQSYMDRDFVGDPQPWNLLVDMETVDEDQVFRRSTSKIWVKVEWEEEYTKTILGVTYNLTRDVPLKLSKINDREVLEQFLRFGYYEGDFKDGKVDRASNDMHLYVTGDYMNYMVYVEGAQKDIDWGDYGSDYQSNYDYRCYHNNTNHTCDGNPELGYGDYISNKVYVKMAGDIRPFFSIENWEESDIPNGVYIDDRYNENVAIIGCDKALDGYSDHPEYGGLKVHGWVKAKVIEFEGTGCTDFFGVLAIRYTLFSGNFLNYLDMKKSRRYNAIDAMWDVISARPHDARYGIMQFDLGIQTKFFDLSHWQSQGADLSVPCEDCYPTANGDLCDQLADIKRVLYGKFSHKDRMTNPEFGQPLYFGHPADISKETPLAESLIEAGCYFAGAESWFNDDPFTSGFFDETHSGDGSSAKCTYKSPIQCPDQKNHVVILTDGSPRDDFEIFDGFLTRNGKGATWMNIIEKSFVCYDPNDNTKLTNTKIGNYYKSDPLSSDNDVWMSKIIKGDNGKYATLGSVNYKQKWLDDVAKFLYDYDMSNLSNEEGRQNIHTHVIGFEIEAGNSEIDRFLMELTAENGHGRYVFSDDKEKLKEEINAILDSVMEDFSFSSAATPVNQSDMIYTGNDLYMSSFIYESGARGRGNITKFDRDGDVVKGYGPADLFDEDGNVKPTTRDCWYPGTAPTNNPADNPKAKDGLARILYDQINSNLSFSDSSTPREILNAVRQTRNILFLRGGLLEDITELALDGSIEILKEGGGHYGDNDNPQAGGELDLFLSRKIYGYGYNWPLGDIVHSNLAVAYYPDPTNPWSNGSNYLFVGTNAGLLHCFNVSSGAEEWAVVYPDFKDRLHQLESFFDDEEHWFADGYITLYYVNDDHPGTVDGKNIAYVVKNPKYLIAGERRGGEKYHIIDISTVGSPFYNGDVGKETDAHAWGQSWSNPQLCQVKDSYGRRTKGFMVAGGYDTNQDDIYLSSEDDEGRFVAIYKFDGTPIHILGVDASGAPDLAEACIVGARIIDHDHVGGKNRIFSRIYAGDLKGNVYTWEDAQQNGAWGRGNKLFSGPTFPVSIGGTTRTLYQKIFYAPVAGMACSEDRVFFCTGDREHPLSDYSGFKDSVYSVPDSRIKTYTRSDLTKFILDASSITEMDKDGNTLPATGSIPGGVVQEVYGNIEKAESGNMTSCKAECDDAALACIEACAIGVETNNHHTCELDCSLKKEHCNQQCGRGWYFDFIRGGEKVVSPPIVMDDVLIFGTYTPPTITITGDVCNAGGTCVPGRGRVYVVSSCEDSFAVKSYKLVNNPMPQPSLVFDADSGKVLVSTGDGTIIDPQLPVIVPDYWKHSGSAL